MMMLRIAILALATAGLSATATAQHTPFGIAFGKRFQFTSANRLSVPPPGTETIHRWNQIAIDATGLDHTPVLPGEDRVFGEQLGPGRSARAMAIVHVAIFDALNAISNGYIASVYRGFTNLRPPQRPISSQAAIAQAAHDTLVAVYPSQAEELDKRLGEDLAAVSDPVERANGSFFGQRVARAILNNRQGDGVETPEPVLGMGYLTSDLAGHWRQDPVSQIPLALGAFWGACRPFVLSSGDQFRAPEPPAMTSPEYTAAYDEVKRLGGDGVTTPTERTPEQSFVGVFWAYDGVPSLCAPPRFYNQLTVTIADQTGLRPLQLARLLALVNVAMADAGITGWESKFHWDLWRPITGIRESDPGTGPTGSGDGNPLTVGDPGFMPLGAPASNLTGPNFTPPFPSYPSGHATFGGAIFQVLRRFYGRDDIAFTLISDEFNGVTRGNDGQIRPLMPRTFQSFTEAETENGRSRVYLGIHWAFDSTGGIALGRQIGDYVFDHAFRPVRGQ